MRRKLFQVMKNHWSLKMSENHGKLRQIMDKFEKNVFMRGYEVRIRVLIF